MSCKRVRIEFHVLLFQNVLAPYHAGVDFFGRIYPKVVKVIGMRCGNQKAEMNIPWLERV